MKDSVLSQIKVLEGMAIQELKAKYIEVFGSEKGVQNNNKKTLIKHIVHRIQENTLGGLKKEAKDEINKLIEEVNPLKDLGKVNDERGNKENTEPSKNKRMPLPGTIIKKTYKGNLLEVKVLQSGFEYKGKNYKSLSMLAKEISGVHCSGFAFFRI